MKAYLQRINPDNAEVWFYSLQIQPDLLGRWQVIKNWGRSGAPGTMRHSAHDELAEAIEQFEAVKRQVLKKGYQVVMQEGLKPSMAKFLKGGASVP